MKGNDRTYLLREAKMSSALFRLGIPIVISMLVSALYNLVDTYFISGLGTTQVAAVSVAFPVSLVFSGLGLTFGVGGGSYISRLLGAGQKEKADKVASTALITGGSAIFVAVIVLIFLNPVLQFMGATDTILPYAKDYAAVFIISTVFNAINAACGNLAVSQGASSVSMAGMLAGAVLNMVLDPLLIYTPGLGVRGTAVATLLSQIATFGIYLIFFGSAKSYVRFSFWRFSPSGETYAEIIKIGLSMFFLQLLASLSMSLVTRGASAYGDEAVAALGVVLRIITIGSNVVFVYMKGFQPIAGFNYGARNYERVRQAVRRNIKWTTVFGIIWSIAAFVISKPLISLFGASTGFIDIGVMDLCANTIMFFSFGFQFTYSTLYLALGKAAPGMVLNLNRQGIFFIPLILLLPHFWGLYGVVYAQAIADACTVVLTAALSVKINRELK